MLFFRKPEPTAFFASHQIFNIVFIVKEISCRIFSALTSVIIYAAYLVSIFINNYGSTGRVFTYGNVQAAFNLINYFAVLVDNVGAHNVFRKRICRNNSFLIKRVQETFGIGSNFAVIVYAKKFGVKFPLEIHSVQRLEKFFAKKLHVQSKFLWNQRCVLQNFKMRCIFLELVQKIIQKGSGRNGIQTCGIIR